MFNLFHRARTVIRGASKNELQRGGLLFLKKERNIPQKKGKNHTEQYESETRLVQGGKRRGEIALGSGESLEAECSPLTDNITKPTIHYCNTNKALGFRFTETSG